MKKEVRCIICPNACLITVYHGNNGEIVIENALCSKGEEYAKEEFTAPKRVLTTTVQVEIDGVKKYLPVKTAGMIPKESIYNCMKELAKVVVKKKVKKGSIISNNLCNTGIDVIAGTDVDYLV